MQSTNHRGANKAPGNRANTPRSRPGPTARFTLEPLEPRLLLSVSIDPAGVMTVTGTHDHDAIRVRPGSDPSAIVLKSTVDGDSGRYTGITALVIDARDGDDKVKITGRLTAVDNADLPVTINGGRGDDRITGGPGPEHIDGGPGNDRINARAGNDTLFGSGGNDRLNAGPGGDTVSGGPGADRINGNRGRDQLTYADSPNGVVVDLAKRRAPEDGHGHADPRIKGFESVLGSQHPDQLLAHKKKDTDLDGNGGADLLARPLPAQRAKTQTGVVGRTTDENGVARLFAVPDADDTATSTNLTDTLDDHGRFLIDQHDLETILGTPLKKRTTHHLRLIAEDTAGNTTELTIPVRKGFEYDALLAAPSPTTGDTEAHPTPNDPLPDGSYQITATATDAAGNTSAPSAPQTLVVDTTRPALEATVVQIDPDIESSTPGGTGSISPFDPLEDNQVTFHAPFRFDFVVPMTIHLAPESDTGPSDVDRITNDTTPTFLIAIHIIPFDRDVVIDIELNGTLTDVLPYEHGEWTTGPLEDGVYHLRATPRIISSSEPPELLIPAELEFTIDTVPPAPPSVRIDPDSDSGRSNADAVTNINIPEFTLTGDDDSFITLAAQRVALPSEPPLPGTPHEPSPFNPDDQSQIPVLTLLSPGTHPAGSARSFNRFDITERLAAPLRRHTFDDGIYHATAEATDLAGNVTAAEAPYTFTIDTTPPWPPIIELTPESDSGISQTDNITADNTPTFNVTAQPDSDLTLYVNGDPFAQAGPTGSDTTPVTLGTP